MIRTDSPAWQRRIAETALLAAAIRYAQESEGGESPLEAGAKLRLAAKEYYRVRKATGGVT